THGLRVQHHLGHDEITLGKIGRERPADAGRDHQGRRRRSGDACLQRSGARARADELEGTAAKMRPGAPDDAIEAQVPGQTAGLEIDSGDDEDAGHGSLDGVGPESLAEPDVPFAASLARSQAAYELPAAVS